MPRPLRVARPPAARTVTTVALACLAAAPVAAVALAARRIWACGAVDESLLLGRADAIVVLGAALRDGRPSPVFRARLDHAVDLWRAGRAPRLVMTGGRRADERTTEAAAGRAHAVAAGVPGAAILAEDRGRSTLESLEGVARIAAAEGIGPILFVSDRSHMLRVLRMARDLGLEAHGSPAPRSPMDATIGRRLDATVYELLALAWYRLGGRPTGEPPTAEAVGADDD